MDALTEELKRLDKQGAVRELSEAEVERTKAWTPLIVKQKPNGKWRMITDLRSLNGCFRTAKFKQQTWKTIRGVLELSGAKWGTKLDVREFFHHLGLCRETQRWVRFQGKEGKYQAKAMPFGLAASPFWANKFAKVLQAALNKKKINHLWYVDDVLVLGDTAQQCAEKTNEALQILDNLGVQLNKEKCELEPKEQVEYLGMNIDLKNGCIAALTSRLNAVCREVTKLKHAGSTCATRLARVAGKLEYLQVGMPSAIGLGKQLMFEAGKLAEKHGWMKTTTKNDKVHGLLKTIQQALKITTPNPINRPWKQKSNLTTDASDFGWGAVLEGPKMKKTSRGLFSRQEVREHITRKEVFAIELAVRNLSPKIPDQSHLEVWTDCTVTAAVWRKGSVKEKLMKGVTETILLLAKRGISMSTQWIPGEKNTKADKLSRKWKEPNDYQIDPKILKRFCQVNKFKVKVDCFASRHNRQCDAFWSWFPEWGACETNAFRQSWGGKQGLYMNPPWPVLPKVIKKIRSERATVCIVAPKWQAAPWWRAFQSMVEVQQTVEGRTFRDGTSRLLPQPRWKTVIAILKGDKPNGL
jgi:hypothetical protein